MKGSNVVIIILTVLVVGMGAYLVYDKLIINDSNENATQNLDNENSGTSSEDSNSQTNDNDVSNNTSEDDLQGLKSATLCTFDGVVADENGNFGECKTKTITDKEKLKEILKLYNTLEKSNVDGIGGTLNPSLTLNFENEEINITFIGGVPVINNETYIYNTTMEYPTKYIYDLFE